ncbi:MAG: aldo/keto reductase [Spirosomaceae bacterium]|nr:aldo/keto reductase [Spirosomataceae bacterium]
MKKVYISDSGPKVSEAIYGFWRWSDEGEVSVSKIEEITNLCLELGINTFDHADSYGNEQVEENFGKVIQNKSFKREDIVLFSKCGIRESVNGKFTYYDNSREFITNSVDNSLKKLKTDYLDIFLLSHFDLLADIEQTAMTLESLVHNGKVKHIGVANFTVFQHQLLASHLNIPIVTNHVELNLMNLSAVEDGRIDFLKQQYSKPLAWSPLAGGNILNGQDPKSLNIRAKLEKLGTKYDANVEQMAVSWLIKLGTLPIIGSLSENRIRNAATATSINIDKQDWYEIYQLALKS